MLNEAISFYLKNPASVVYLIGKKNYLKPGERRKAFANGSVLYTAGNPDNLRKSYVDCIFLDTDEPLPEFFEGSKVREI